MCLILEAAWHTLKLEARYLAQGNAVDAERAHQRAVDAIERTSDPVKTYLTLADRYDRRS